MMTSLFQHFISIFVESSPWLLLGFFIAGLIKALVPIEFLHRHLGENTAKSVLKAAILGAPLPLCSCGVIPAALGIRRAGASKAATTSFLIATPETGVDSVSVTYALLGPFMAIIRPIAAITTAISAGLAVLWLTKQKAEKTDNQPHKESDNDCCGSKPVPKISCCTSKEKEEPPEKTCCGSKKVEKISYKNALWGKIRVGLLFTFIDLIKDTAKWILIGLIIAALIMTIIPAEFLATWGAGPYAYIIMALIGVPMYICATASTPIAAGLLFAGVSPGAILVFLLVGPATNIATMVIVKNELGNKILGIYLSVIITLSFLFGWLTDALSTNFNLSVINTTQNHQHTSLAGTISAIIFACLLLNGLRLKHWK